MHHQKFANVDSWVDERGYSLSSAQLRQDTGLVLSRQTGYDPGRTQAALTACRDAWRRCGEECDRLAGMHEHCRVCAEACRRCGEECDRLLAA